MTELSEDNENKKEQNKSQNKMAN